jgi:hypothetical protein
MNFLSVVVVHTGKNATPIPDSVGFFILGMLVLGIIFSLVVAYVGRNDPKPILKRTKNPHRRYKLVGYRQRK